MSHVPARAGHLVFAIPVTSLSAARHFLINLQVATELADFAADTSLEYGDEVALAGIINIFHALAGLG